MKRKKNRNIDESGSREAEGFLEISKFLFAKVARVGNLVRDNLIKWIR